MAIYKYSQQRSFLYKGTISDLNFISGTALGGPLASGLLLSCTFSLSVAGNTFDIISLST